ncbi:MAG: TRAP transporter substrate-binding protein [Deltaproteobacteria bacterium]|nr:MAG: TRAP transporter substrate-binding protein [Deltaproteobacteria bacterium]
MKHFGSVITVLAAVILVVALTATDASSESERAVTLKFGTWWPTVHVMNNVMERWAKEIETSTEGKIKVKYFPGGTLLNAKTGLDNLSSGIADLASISGLLFPGQLPSFQVGSMPFLFSSATHATNSLNEMIPTYFERECEVNNIKLLSVFTPPILQFISTKQIRDVDDLKGLRIRSHGRSDEMLRLLGAIPIGLPPGELYTSLQRGIVDGVLFPLSASKAFKLQEICKHVTVADLYVSNVLLAMNLDIWKRLPKDIQEEIHKTAIKTANEAASAYDKSEVASYDVFKKAGAIIYKLPDNEKARWGKIIAPAVDNWVNENKSKGLPAQEMLDRLGKLSEKYK